MNERSTVRSISDGRREANLTRAVFLLVPGYSMLSFSAAVDALRQANRMAGKALFEWKVVGRTREAVSSNNGIAIVPDFALNDPIEAHMVFVCASTAAEKFHDRHVYRWLRALATKARIVGAIATGSYVLARAGLLKGRKCSMHWQNAAAFGEEFPEIEVEHSVFTIDGPIVTCSGGTASLDMMLYLIREMYGADLAAAISNMLIHDHGRTPEDSQGKSERIRLARKSQRLAAAVSLMERHLSEPLAIADIAGAIGTTQRQVERIFKRHCGMPPHTYYLDLRLQRARQLLMQTDRALIDIAVASGFASLSHFSVSYKRRFGVSPSHYRRRVEDSDGTAKARMVFAPATETLMPSAEPYRRSRTAGKRKISA